MLARSSILVSGHCTLSYGVYVLHRVQVDTADISALLASDCPCILGLFKVSGPSSREVPDALYVVRSDLSGTFETRTRTSRSRIS